MFLIVGLGNPGASYERTRHNVGFLVVDELARRLHTSLRKKRAVEAEIGEADADGLRVLLCKPQTFMNVSGRAVQKILKKYPVTPKDLIVVYDDADLAFGDVRVKAGGSSAGHRGMQSLMESMPVGTNIARVRVGIGRPDHPDTALEDFVLQPWTAKEETQLAEVVARAAQEALAYAR